MFLRVFRCPTCLSLLLFFLTVTVVFSQPPTVASLEGNVIDALTKQPINGAIVSLQQQQSLVVQRQKTDLTGGFRFRLDPAQPYLIKTKADGYQAAEEPFTITSIYTNRIQGKLIRLKRFEIGTTTQLHAVQFVQSKAELLPNSQPALDELLTFLRDNPTVEIELAGHTDNQGDSDLNLALSKQRVDVVKAFLVKNGVAARRITSRGYGGTRPIASNATEETRQLNRRVELVITKR